MSEEAVWLLVTPGAIERLTAVDRPSLVVSVSPPPTVPCPVLSNEPALLARGDQPHHEWRTPCIACHGSRVVPLALPWVGAQLVVPCPECGGDGLMQIRTGYHGVPTVVECDACLASGQVPAASCTVITCEGADQEWSDEKNDMVTTWWRYEVTDVVACDPEATEL
jgi:hypothetical protein